MARMPIICHEQCTGCGVCIAVCAPHILVLRNNIVSFIEEPQECNYCAQCEAVCSTGAILCPYEIVTASTAKYTEHAPNL